MSKKNETPATNPTNPPKPDAPAPFAADIEAIKAKVISEAHPAANLFPMMSGDELHNLIVSLKQNGFDPTKPITKNSAGKITDGRNREVAVRAINEEVAAWNADPANKDNPKVPVSGVYTQEPSDNDAEILQGVLSGNFTRRHLSSSQKAAVIVKAGILSGAYQKKKELGAAGERVAGDVVELIASQNGVNCDYIYKVKAIAKTAKVGKGLLEEIASGAKSVMAAYAEIKAIGDGTPKEGDAGAVGDADAVLDGLKKPVAEEMKDTFRAREKFAAVEKLLRDARAALKEIAAGAGGELLADGNNLKEATQGISQTAKAIKNTKPHVVCPHCDGTGVHPEKGGKHSCPVCGGLAYLTEPQHDSFLKNGVMEETEGDETAPAEAAPAAKKGKAKKAEEPVAAEAPAAPAADGEPTIE